MSLSCLGVCRLESEKRAGNQALPPFYSYLHCKVLQFWTRPYSARITNQPFSMAKMWPWYRLRSASPWKSKPSLPSKHFSTSAKAHCMLGYSMAGMVAVEQHLLLTLTSGTETKPFSWMHLCISLKFLISSEVHGGETFCYVKKPMSVFQLILHHQERSLLHHWCISPSQCPAGDSWRVDLRLSSSNHLCKDFSLASRHNLCWRGNPQRCKKWPLPPCSGILVHTLVFNRHTLSQALHTIPLYKLGL